MLTDKCLELTEKHEAGSCDKDFKALNVRAKAVKGLVELVNGNLDSGTNKLLLVICLIVLSISVFLYLNI